MGIYEILSKIMANPPLVRCRALPTDNRKFALYDSLFQLARTYTTPAYFFVIVFGAIQELPAPQRVCPFLLHLYCALDGFALSESMLLASPGLPIVVSPPEA
jgi:hypothetical protein